MTLLIKQAGVRHVAGSNKAQYDRRLPADPYYERNPIPVFRNPPVAGGPQPQVIKQEVPMKHSMSLALPVPIDRGASDEAACAGTLQVLLLMGSGVVAAAQIGKAIISVPMIRSDLALG